MFGNATSSTSTARMLAVAALATMMVAGTGCGGSRGNPSASARTAEAEHVGEGGTMVTAALPAEAAPEGALAEHPGAGEIVPSMEALPPEIVAGVVDTLVVPGAAVEITVIGSPDVREVFLADGIGKPQEFVYDHDTQSWQTFYRMPMRMSGERVGLSVTAKNDAKRWRRVWLFLRPQARPATADSGSTQP
jgi:hypothetical protein